MKFGPCLWPCMSITGENCRFAFFGTKIDRKLQIASSISIFVLLFGINCPIWPFFCLSIILCCHILATCPPLSLLSLLASSTICAASSTNCCALSSSAASAWFSSSGKKSRKVTAAEGTNLRREGPNNRIFCTFSENLKPEKSLD